MIKQKKGYLPYNRPTPFRTPDHYFDNLEQRIMTTIETEQIKVSTVPTYESSILKTKQPLQVYLRSIAAAAIAVIVAGAGVHLISGEDEPLTAEQAFSALSESDQESIIDSYSYMLSMDDGTF